MKVYGILPERLQVPLAFRPVCGLRQKMQESGYKRRQIRMDKEKKTGKDRVRMDACAAGYCIRWLAVTRVVPVNQKSRTTIPVHRLYDRLDGQKWLVEI